jgi:hypothetical protein
LFSTLLLPVFAAADDYPIELEVVSPVAPKLKGKEADPESHNIQYRSGWPLTFKLITTDEHLLGTLIQYDENNHGTYPEAGVQSALVFEDPDDCPSIEGHAKFFQGDDCPIDPDEVFLEFTAGVDFPGLADNHGREDIRALQDDLFDKPEWGGPATGGESDGVGYGPNDDLPGLVILSNVGVGIVYKPLVIETVYEDCGCSSGICPWPSVCVDVPVDPRPVDWQRADIEARHNLSGLMGSVAYELNDQKGRTTVTTSLVVPRALFTHQVLEDSCYTGYSNNPLCSGSDDFARIIDGGPIVVGKSHPDFDVQVSNVEMRAFVVNGDAPTIVEECDGEEGITAADVECNVDPSTGGFYNRISNEIVLEVEQRGIANFVLWGDLDGNTQVLIETAVSPGGGGGVTRPPR